MERSQKGVYSFDWSAAILEWCPSMHQYDKWLNHRVGVHYVIHVFKAGISTVGIVQPTFNLLKDSLIGCKQYLISVSIEVQLITIMSSLVRRALLACEHKRISGCVRRLSGTG